MRISIVLECNCCKNRNYITTKNKKTTINKIEINKYCKKCKKHTIHKETK